MSSAAVVRTSKFYSGTDVQTDRQTHESWPNQKKNFLKIEKYFKHFVFLKIPSKGICSILPSEVILRILFFRRIPSEVILRILFFLRIPSEVYNEKVF